VRGDEIDFSEKVRKFFLEFAQFIFGRMTRSLRAKRFEAQARQMILGLFKSYYSNPLILEDYLLLRYKEWKGVNFLRDIPENKVSQEIAKHYHGKSSFICLICDHLAGMTDSYAIHEFHTYNRHWDEISE
jgi:dGTP triphosphohydrolase